MTHAIRSSLLRPAQRVQKVFERVIQCCLNGVRSLQKCLGPTSANLPYESLEGVDGVGALSSSSRVCMALLQAGKWHQSQPLNCRSSSADYSSLGKNKLQPRGLRRQTRLCGLNMLGVPLRGGTLFSAKELAAGRSRRLTSSGRLTPIRAFLRTEENIQVSAVQPFASFVQTAKLRSAWLRLCSVVPVKRTCSTMFGAESRRK